jgi:hypothetical protein
MRSTALRTRSTPTPRPEMAVASVRVENAARQQRVGQLAAVRGAGRRAPQAARRRLVQAGAVVGDRHDEPAAGSARRQP